MADSKDASSGSGAGAHASAGSGREGGEAQPPVFGRSLSTGKSGTARNVFQLKLDVSTQGAAPQPAVTTAPALTMSGGSADSGGGGCATGGFFSSRLAEGSLASAWDDIQQWQSASPAEPKLANDSDKAEKSDAPTNGSATGKPAEALSGGAEPVAK
jgi:hypothetical protein